MGRIVIRPRIQIPVLVVVFAVWALIGVTYFTPGDAVAERDWFGIILGCVLIITGLAGIWRASRLGIVIDSNEVRIRSFDSRDRVIPWRSIRSVDCKQVDLRAGIPLYAPVIQLQDDVDAFPVRAFGSYSRPDAERKVERLRELMGDDES